MIRTKKDLREYLSADLEAHGVARWHWWMRFTRDVLTWQRELRRMEYRSQQAGLLTLLARYRFHRHSIRLGFDIPLHVFGKGLCILHWGSIVVSPMAQVGEFCRLQPGTTIGEEEKDEAPVVGDRACIGPGVRIVGGVRLGNDVVIGANAVVIESFEDDSVLVGAPAAQTRRSLERIGAKKQAAAYAARSGSGDALPFLVPEAVADDEPRGTLAEFMHQPEERPRGESSSSKKREIF